MGRCIDAVYKQLNQKLVRKSAIEALSQFTVTLFKLNKIERAQEAVLKLVPKFFEYDIGHDDIAMIVLQSYIDILNQMKGKALVNGKVEEMFLDSFVHVFESSLDDTEYCFTLQVLAGKVLFAFGQALSSQEFQKHFESVFKLLSEKLKKAENNDNLYSERGLIYDILSKCFDVLKQYTAKWFVKLLPSYLTDISNEKFEVCRNVIIGLGKMVLFSDNTAHHFIGDIFEKLSQIVSKGTEDGIRDHICGVIAQLILTNQTNVPIEYMMPLIIQNIPLHKEFYENKAVFKAFHKILKTKSEFFIQHLKRVICADLLTLGEKSYEDDGECKRGLILFYF